MAKKASKVSTFAAWKVSKYGISSGPYFPVFGLNTEIYGVNQNTGKYGPEKTPLYLDTFHAVIFRFKIGILQSFPKKETILYDLNILGTMPHLKWKSVWNCKNWFLRHCILLNLLSWIWPQFPKNKFCKKVVGLHLQKWIPQNFLNTFKTF